MRSRTTTLPTNIPKCAPGSSAILDGCSTSPRPRHSGSTLSKASSQRLTRQRLKRGVFRSVADLEQAIARYIREHNGDPKPFVWTKPAKVIIGKLSRLPEPSV